MADLITKFRHGLLSQEESAELESWLQEDPKHRALLGELTDPALLQQGRELFESFDSGRAWEQVMERTGSRGHRRRWLKWWPAAAVVAGLGVGYFFKWQAAHPDRPALTAGAYGNDLPPGRDTAYADDGKGHRIPLGTGAVAALPAGMHYSGDSGLVYADARGGGERILTVPAGGTYRLVLPDGTRAWLNAASSLRFPAHFGGSERRVELSGEGYFEVAKNKALPFRVHCRGTVTEAVGTAFNVEGYTPKVRTVLLHGTVRVTAGRHSTLLLPGKEVSALDGTGLSAVSEADTAMAAGWQRGNFVFEETPLEDVMGALARWYGLQVSYAKGYHSGRAFTGEVSRQVPLSRLLSMITLAGIARFHVRDSVVTVTN